ncbi:hypothetical protein ONE63_001685 [Megalurothrips usitatus]|uniref:DUF4773 domain-containing protein n=1 Tax=Megalurothrips usitatus TaxID=439358 RepID=A0AAV7XDP9_9NEOP|nr:hypothetical protein ONE63_001685 [Megalurothrips usitatus]
MRVLLAVVSVLAAAASGGGPLPSAGTAQFRDLADGRVLAAIPGRVPVAGPPAGAAQGPHLGPSPCTCSSTACACCAYLAVDILTFHWEKKVCVNVFASEGTVVIGLIVEEEVVIDRWELQLLDGVLGPQEFCVIYPPAFLDFCLRLVNIYFENGTLHLCIDLLARSPHWPVSTMHFHCLTFPAPHLFRNNSATATHPIAPPRPPHRPGAHRPVHDKF